MLERRDERAAFKINAAGVPLSRNTLIYERLGHVCPAHAGMVPGGMMDEAKKDFMPAAPPPGWKLNPKHIECRTRRT